MTNYQNRMFRGYLVGMPYSQDTCENQLSWLFVFQSCVEHMLHFAGSLLTSYPRKHLWSWMSLESSHSLSHTTFTMKSHKNTGYKRLNKITIKFGMELKPTQISCKSQLYSLPFWLFHDKTPKTNSRLKREFGNNGKTHSHLI